MTLTFYGWFAFQGWSDFRDLVCVGFGRFCPISGTSNLTVFCPFWTKLPSGLKYLVPLSPFRVRHLSFLLFLCFYLFWWSPPLFVALMGHFWHSGGGFLSGFSFCCSTVVRYLGVRPMGGGFMGCSSLVRRVMSSWLPLLRPPWWSCIGGGWVCLRAILTRSIGPLDWPYWGITRWQKPCF